MASTDNKRKAEDAAPEGDAAAADGQPIKKARPSEEGVANGAAGAQPKPAVDLSVLAKARKALAMQGALKEKLQRLKAASASAVPVARPGAVPGKPLPPPLVLDAEGREVGAAAPAAKPAARLDLAPAPTVHADDDEFFDPAIGSRALRRLQRRARPELRFVEEGKYQKQAETTRLRAEFGDDYVRDLEQRRQQEKAAAAKGFDANLVPLGKRIVQAPEAEEEPPVPDVEWWDAKILEDKTTYGAAGAEGGEASLRPDRITHLVEHPVLLQPPAEAPPPLPQPLMLTKAELKKLRTQRRNAREKEKQELIRQGLLEPPKPKVKISNLMRVLGAEAAADPTAIEAEVRRQMAERAAAHDDRNIARMLTPAERRDKKLRKLLGRPAPGAAAGGEDGDDAGPAGPVDVQVALYKVGDLTAPQLSFKVVMNAKELHMSGAAVAAAGAFCLVIVEGTVKALRRYEKLMLRRINWNAGLEDEEEGEEEEEGHLGTRGKPLNYCHLVWQGVVKEPAFKGKFKSLDLPSEAAARRVLDERGVGHYWDTAAAFMTG